MEDSPNRQERQKIKEHAKKMLFVEGHDEVIFFERLLEKELEIRDIQVYETGGKQKFQTILPAVVKQSNFDNIERIGIIQDSDDNTEGTFESIRNTLSNNGLNPPDKLTTFNDDNPSIGVFLLPDNSDTGMLETLCLRTVEGDDIIDCIDRYFECLDGQNIEINNLHKARAQVYLASQKKIIKHVGRGAQKGIWNFDAECMNDLKDFLNEI